MLKKKLGWLAILVLWGGAFLLFSYYTDPFKITNRVKNDVDQKIAAAKKECEESVAKVPFDEVWANLPARYLAGYYRSCSAIYRNDISLCERLRDDKEIFEGHTKYEECRAKFGDIRGFLFPLFSGTLKAGDVEEACSRAFAVKQFGVHQCRALAETIVLKKDCGVLAYPASREACHAINAGDYTQALRYLSIAIYGERNPTEIQFITEQLIDMFNNQRNICDEYWYREMKKSYCDGLDWSSRIAL